MENDTGLPDFVGDHFKYMVRGSAGVRFGQLIFFGSGLALPVIAIVGLKKWAVEAGFTRTLLIAVLGLFVASLLWYLQWMQSRLQRFRAERPSSYSRWFDRRRKRKRVPPALHLRLTRLHLRYLILSRPPTSAETLSLSMMLARRGT
jgi:hypothetical protein